MKLCRACLLLFLSLGCSSALDAQQNYRVERFTTDNGLPSNGIKGLEWDESTGFLWIATEAGVTRYNGADFSTFSRINTPQLFSDRMLLMLKNLAGRIYTVDEAGNIFFIIENRLQFLDSVTLGTRSSTVKLIGLASSGQLFRQSAGQPPAVNFGFNCARDILMPVSDTNVLIYHTDTLYGLAPGLYDYTAGIKDPVLVIPLEKDARLFRLAGQLFVFTARRQVFRLDTDAHRPLSARLVAEKDIPGLPRSSMDEKERIFWENGMAHPIVIAGSRAWLLEYKDQRLDARLISEAVPTDMMLDYAQYAEKNGILFLGTNSRGIVLVRKNQVIPVKKDPPDITETTACYSQLALPNGSIMANRLDHKAAILGGPPPPPSLLPVKTPTFDNFLLITPDSTLWYSFSDSIYSYSYRTGRTAACYAEKGSITTGFALSGNALYLANAVGIGEIQNGKIDYRYRYPEPDVNSHAPFSMLEIAPGQLAIASCSGLTRYDTRTGRLDTMLHIPGICIRALWKYKDYLFIGTYGKGIFLWKQGVLKPIPLDKNKYLEYAHCFIPDRNGFFWISTNKGLFRVLPEDMVNAFEKNIPQIYYQYYGQNDGMDITELNGGCTPCALSLNDSALSFPSMDGLIRIDPTIPDPPVQGDNIYIDAGYADGEMMNATSLVTPKLPPNTHELVFQLGFPAWTGVENIYIEYKLEPYSPKWQLLEIQNDPAIRFSNLPPGDYRLQIRKLNGSGRNNYSFKESSFRIAAHWYQQEWAWLFSICCLVALVVALVGLRTRQFQIRQNRLEHQIAIKTNELKLKNDELEKTDHIKTRLISIISHDLVTPLRFLHMAGKSLLENKHELSEELQEETVTEMMNTSKELELLSTNILNWIKYRNDERRLAKESFSLHQLTAQLFGIFNWMAKQKQIRLINSVEERLQLYQFIDPVKVVLYNLLLNGINFTPEGYIQVSSSRSQEGVMIVIQDTGVGMTQDQINNIMADHFIISSANVDNRKGNGLGYLIIKDLLKIIKGSLSIQSGKGKGTTVTIRLPA
jgi:signal transduction histidine kinase